jgi:hypothetical protein
MRRLELARRTESGICHGGRAALEEFTELRRITVPGQPREYPI